VIGKAQAMTGGAMGFYTGFQMYEDY